ncbi:MAG: alpha-glucan family phosphorylase [Saprospiraceae bacterium]|nr:alpha-glucan family phosphorylase [Saprospiraceae bacterium]MDW8484957.1 alpha-glucan family phosphorylase [Saprospiraceae bacterium]
MKHPAMVGNLTEGILKLKRIFVEPTLPAGLAPLRDLAHNLWWSWHHEAIELFRSINPNQFEKLNYNPLALLDNLSVEEAQDLLKNAEFMRRMERVLEQFRTYIARTPERKHPLVAYFCMEYGLHQSLRLYSGGLGVLAGDYLKEASDRGSPIVGVGLLYRYGYFQQAISLHGEQIHQSEAAKFTQLPLLPVRDARGEWVKIHVNFGRRTVWAKAWLLNVGRVPLYLLDTDIDDNTWEDRGITHQLYGGDNEHRLKQEILLGIGGVRLLQTLNLKPDVYHLNEGHAAFLGLERLRYYIKTEQFSFDEALEIVRATQLFTTHTPVPAGHDAFSEPLLRTYLFDYLYELDIPWDTFMAMGRVSPQNTAEPFSVSHFALRTSSEANGVSRLHGEVSRRMFNNLYPDYHFAEIHIGHITNSVHFDTWVAPAWAELYAQQFGPDFEHRQDDPNLWAKIYEVPDETIAQLRKTLKKRLLEWVRKTLREDLTRRGENPRTIFEMTNALEERALVIGFARRFATYKRATLLFTNEKRLAAIVNNPERPVLFLFAGKAHPADKGGQEFIRFIYNITKNPVFRGKVIFLENYGMEMAKLLVQGTDLWLNTPTRPKEASGTSGMKAVLNGVLNLSVLDGWWIEGYRPGAGWALPEHETYSDPNLQNELDAETLYNILETEVIPAYFEQNECGFSPKWIGFIKKNLAEIAPHFVMKRMLDDYQSKYYDKLWKRSQRLMANQYHALRELVEWKNRVKRVWEAIELVSLQAPDTFNYALPLGKSFEAKVTLNLQTLGASDVGVEVVFLRRRTETDLELVEIHELKLDHQDGAIATYSCNFTLREAGVFEYGFRLFPKHPLLAHRQDFPLVRWL